MYDTDSPIDFTERPVDPRGGFKLSPEGEVSGTAWGACVSLTDPTPPADNKFDRQFTNS